MNCEQPQKRFGKCELLHRRKVERMLVESAAEIDMRPLINADQNISQWQRTENHNRAESAVATIWLVFYVLALGVAITSPFVADVIELAFR
jgi:hypothetical protein